MNILPKKRWHVRTRENIARVRRDEAAAAEEERKRQLKVELAEKEARTALLREKARSQYGYQPEPKPEVKKEEGAAPSTHVNLFYELEENDIVSDGKNAEHEKEAKEEKEKEEMKIGYLTYLGQDTNELNRTTSWYNKAPLKNSAEDASEVGIKEKLREDPLQKIKKYLNSDTRKSLPSTPVSLLHNSMTSVLPAIEKQADHLKTIHEKKIRKLKKKLKKKYKEKYQRKKKHKRKCSRSSSSSESEDKNCIKRNERKKIDLQALREKRLQREKEERLRAAATLARLQGIPDIVEEPTPPPSDFSRKYNSQFNPHLARQNFT